MSEINKALYYFLISIGQEFNRVSLLKFSNIQFYIKNSINIKYFYLFIYTYLYLSIFIMFSVFFDYAGLYLIVLFLLFTLSISILIYIYSNDYLLNEYPVLSIILISFCLLIILYFLYNISCLHIEILKDFILWARIKYIKESNSKGNDNNNNNPGKPGPGKPKTDIRAMEPDAKKKHIKNRRKGMDEAYDRTEEGKARNERYRNTEKEAISRKKRNARSVAKRAVLRKQGEYDKRAQELENVIAAEYDDLKNARVEWHKKELAECEARLNEYKKKWEDLQKEM